MDITSYTAEAFARLQMGLLPPASWKQDGVLYKVFLAAGDELVRLGERAKTLITESIASKAVELLEEYEREFGVVATGTVEERQAFVSAKQKRRPRFRPIDVRAALAPFLGLSVEDVQLIEISRADAVAMNSDSAKFRFYVYRDPSLTGDYDVAAAQVELDRISQSHTKGKVIERTAARCDDPMSLCDRDLVGAP